MARQVKPMKLTKHQGLGDSVAPSDLCLTGGNLGHRDHHHTVVAPENFLRQNCPRWHFAARL
jgi:hypothetical protein